MDAYADLAEFSSNNFGYNFGGGAFIFLGIELRRAGRLPLLPQPFQSDEDSLLPLLQEGTFNFTRASVGVVFRF